MALPYVESCLLTRASRFGIKSAAEVLLKDTKDKVHFASTEIQAVYPFVHKCQIPWPPCPVRLTAHQNAYCEQFGALRLTAKPLRCQSHADWMRPSQGGILQVAKCMAKESTEYTKVHLKEVQPMMYGYACLIPTADEKKERQVLIRVDDILLHEMWMEINLKGSPGGDSFQWELAAPVRGRMAAGVSAGGFQRFRIDAEGLLVHKDGVCITIELARALDLLYTMRLGF